MHKDLVVQSNMDSVVGMLFAAVKENYERLLTLVQGLSQAEIDYKGPTQQSNSIAQLLRHLTYVDINWVFRLKNEPLPNEIKQKLGPMLDKEGKLPNVVGVPLEELLSEYKEVMLLLEKACTRLTNDDLINIVVFGHNNEKTATIRWGIWHIADHSRYHHAHINLLKRWYVEYNSN